MAGGYKKRLPEGPIPFPLRLASIKATRQTFSRVLREFGKGTLDKDVYRQIVWGLSNYQSILKLEHENALEERIAALEAQSDPGA